MEQGMALFLIFSKSWQSFCQTVQQTFPMKKKLCQTENMFFKIQKKSLKLATFQKESEKSLIFQHHFGNPAQNRD